MTIPSLVVFAIGIILFGAAVAIAVPTLISRHTYRSFVGTSSAHQVLTDVHASWVVDRALRSLAQACVGEAQRLPGIVMVVLDADSIAVHVASPSQHPPRPWDASPGGLVWSAKLADLQSMPVDSGRANPWTGLFTIGVSDAGRVFVDLDQAHGLISIGGDPTSRREVARRWIDEAAARTWATGPVVFVGLDDRAEPSSAPGPTVYDVIALVKTGTPGLVFIEGAPHPDQAALLARALESEKSRCPVIIVGATDDARWRFTAQENGWMTSDFLPAARFTPEASDAVAVAA